MRIIFLGEYGGFPGVNSATSSFLIEEEGFTLLVDCGSGVLSKLQEHIPWSSLDACILSHYHHDHVADIGCLQYAMLVQSQLGNRHEILPIYGHSKDSKFMELDFEQYTKGIEITADYTTKIGPFTITFCETTHPVYCLAMKFQTLHSAIVYTADTEWNEQLVSFASGADVLISEASIYKEQEGLIKGHLTGEQAGKLAQESGVKHLYLTHLPHYGIHENLVKEAKTYYNGPIQIVKSGLKVKIE
ncbi:MBL fold metallo-hydrolase [Bacillus sp. B1-b2]|uniref:MBL fold metallo-hydrolase n=1 Tax=Bacillus sp. B1-b2 TaxID=2653201 RepID=UPI0012629912|nr:MBL fold metallo-hydrolase [Bacillus sp. B1-b2]KAB7664905.1 MBL fold metallo-hydrolase [Bacillus sp. B1-b2]